MRGKVDRDRKLFVSFFFITFFVLLVECIYRIIRFILLIAGKVACCISLSDELFVVRISGYPVFVYLSCRDVVLLSGRNPSGVA